MGGDRTGSRHKTDLYCSAWIIQTTTSVHTKNLTTEEEREKHMEKERGREREREREGSGKYREGGRKGER